MATTRGDPQRVLFARVGWMRFYNGPMPGDERPGGGGSYNKEHIGAEAYISVTSAGDSTATSDRRGSATQLR
jgi:hypothetical protein